MPDCCSHTSAEPLDLPEAAATSVAVDGPTRTWIRDFLSKQGVQDPVIRLEVVRTGCMGGRGHTYSLVAVPRPDDVDEVHEVDGIRFAVDADSARLLADVDVRLRETEAGEGLQVYNSHAVGTCPCGQHDLFA